MLDDPENLGLIHVRDNHFNSSCQGPKRMSSPTSTHESGSRRWNSMLRCLEQEVDHSPESKTEIKYVWKYAVGSKSFRPDIQKPRQMENAVRDI